MDSILVEEWQKMTLPQQMINIGNEVKRAFRFSDIEKQRPFLEKAIFLTDLSLKDIKNENVYPELEIGREVLSDRLNGHSLDCDDEHIKNYYLNFMLL